MTKYPADEGQAAIFSLTPFQVPLAFCLSRVLTEILKNIFGDV